MYRSLALVCLLLAGCAEVRTRAHVMTWAPANPDPKLQSEVQARFDAVRDGPLDDEGKAVLLFVETYPRGVEPAGRQIHVAADSDYALKGSYDLYATGATTFWFADYVSLPRKVACWPQVPLTWVTLGLWQFVSPTAWGCVAKARMARPMVWEQVRHIARAAGAHAAVVLLKVQDDEVIDAWGWLLDEKRSQPR